MANFDRTIIYYAHIPFLFPQWSVLKKCAKVKMKLVLKSLKFKVTTFKSKITTYKSKFNLQNKVFTFHSNLKLTLETLAYLKYSYKIAKFLNSKLSKQNVAMFNYIISIIKHAFKSKKTLL